MAKVMVSLPDDLLRTLDDEAQRRGTTRSALLRTFAGEALERRAQLRARRIEQIMQEATPHGGRGVEELRRLRAEREADLAG